MKQQVWTENYKIASYLVNLRGKAGLYAVLNLIQDVGWLHAINMNVKLEPNHAWVFTRQKLVMHSWPAWNETVTIKTWLRPPSSDTFLLRDYEIYVGEKKLGECTSTFTVIDMTTRRLAQTEWSKYDHLWNRDVQLEHTPGKILFDTVAYDLAQFEVRNSDIDMNNHVNNTKYAQWLLDALPIDTLKAGVDLYGYEVNFVSETKIGDIVKIQQAKNETVVDGKSSVQFRGVRSSDEKVVFTARMNIVRN